MLRFHRLGRRRRGFGGSSLLRTFSTQRTLLELNRFGVDLLPEKFNQRLFAGVKCKPPDPDLIESSLSELEKFGLNSGGLEFKLPDITPYLPPLKGKNVLEHFQKVGAEQVKPYLDILFPLLQAEVPPPPTDWRIASGWTRYGFDGSVESVPFPTGRDFEQIRYSVQYLIVNWWVVTLVQ